MVGIAELYGASFSADDLAPLFEGCAGGMADILDCGLSGLVGAFVLSGAQITLTCSAVGPTLSALAGAGVLAGDD